MCGNDSVCFRRQRCKTVSSSDAQREDRSTQHCFTSGRAKRSRKTGTVPFAAFVYVFAGATLAPVFVYKNCVWLWNVHSARQRAVNTQKNVGKVGHKMPKSWMWFPLHSGKASQQG